jgi:hypothetical protein
MVSKNVKPLLSDSFDPKAVVATENFIPVRRVKTNHEQKYIVFLTTKAPQDSSLWVLTSTVLSLSNDRCCISEVFIWCGYPPPLCLSLQVQGHC